ncbi:hypothetical protein Q8F57_039775 [Paraburkholderia terrae]|uniref:hypothetical protein n=1 Tax=Paraburkholderia terrae TaxID=311230 RepID=UPI00296ABF52|nr:hypothetical protein [Paraburkholderia terrae]
MKDQLREITVPLVLTAERQYRKALQFSHEWDRHSFEEKIGQTRKARDEAEQRERARDGRLSETASRGCSLRSVHGSRHSRFVHTWKPFSPQEMRCRDMRLTASATLGPLGTHGCQRSRPP